MSVPIALRPWAIYTATVAFAGLLGYATALNPAIGVAVLMVLLLLIGTSVSPTYWVLGAVTAAITFRSLATFGVLPSFATYLDFVLAWGALAVALITCDDWSPRARVTLSWLAALAGAILISSLLAGFELFRGVFYLALIGEPVALLCAVLVAPPRPRMRRVLTITVLALLAIQIPIALGQFITHGTGDLVQGTFAGSEAGAHLLGGISAVGAFWFLARRFSWVNVFVVVFLVLLIFLADAKAVILALPVALVAVSPRRRLTFIAGAVLVAAALVVYVTSPYVNQQYGLTEIGRAESGQGGKFDGLKFVSDGMKSSLGTAIFGQGPAQTVSRAAYLTTDPLRKPSSPLAALNLEPSKTALDFGAVSGEGSSFDAARSSAVGLLGDGGILALIAFTGAWGSVFLAVRSVRSPEAWAAAAGIGMLAVLGLVADFWEQGAFTLLVAMLAGLALTQEPDSDSASKARAESSAA
jgi:hypothetical protein